MLSINVSSDCVAKRKHVNAAGGFFKAVQNIIHLIIFFYSDIIWYTTICTETQIYDSQWFSIFCLVLVVNIFDLKITEIIDTSGLQKINIDDSLIKLDLL